MENYKIIEILRTFSKDDIKRFKDFLNSPFFNKSDKLFKLFSALRVFYPQFNSRFLKEEILSKKIDRELPFNKSTIKVLLFELSIAAENYLMHINFQRRSIESKDFLRDELFKRGLNKNIEKNINKSAALLKEVKDFNADYFINKCKLLTDILNNINVNKPRANSSFINLYIDTLTERGKYITYFFVKEMIKEYDDLLTLNKTFKINKENNFVFQLFNKIDFQELLKFMMLNSENESYIKIFEIYYALFLAFSNFEDEKNYYRYKKLLLQNLKYFSMDEIRFHFGRLMRYCMMRSSDEKFSEKYDRERFYIYDFILSKGYYKSSLTSYLPVELFRAILLLSLKLKKYKWTFDFIRKYRFKLHPERRVNMYYYSCAEFYFCRGRYADAMKSFHKVQLNHFMLKLDLKNLMLMTYYELGLFENALSLIDTYKHFLSNNKALSTTERKKNKNFINIIYKMIAYQSQDKRISKYQLENELSNDFPFGDWVKEKFMELDKDFRKAV